MCPDSACDWLVAGYCKIFKDVFTPLQAEALAARDGMVWAASRGFRNLIIEGDSLQIVGAVAELLPICLTLDILWKMQRFGSP